MPVDMNAAMTIPDFEHGLQRFLKLQLERLFAAEATVIVAAEMPLEADKHDLTCYLNQICSSA